MTFAHLDYSLHASVALIRLSHPSDSTNALGMSFLRDLQEATAHARRDRDVKLLLFTGTARSFSSGLDRADLDAANTDQVVALLRAGQSLMRQIIDLDLITVAAINGLALGGGLELALACDIRWAHTRAVVGLPEARLGLFPGWGGMSLLRRAVSESLCLEMLASGECLGARRAYEAGLVSRIFDGRDFEAAIVAEAKKLSDTTAGVLKAVKASLKRDRAAIDLTAWDSAFLSLWNGRAQPAQAPVLAGTNTSSHR